MIKITMVLSVSLIVLQLMMHLVIIPVIVPREVRSVIEDGKDQIVIYVS